MMEKKPQNLYKNQKIVKKFTNIFCKKNNNIILEIKDLMLKENN